MELFKYKTYEETLNCNDVCKLKEYISALERQLHEVTSELLLVTMDEEL